MEDPTDIVRAWEAQLVLEIRVRLGGVTPTPAKVCLECIFICFEIFFLESFVRQRERRPQSLSQNRRNKPTALQEAACTCAQQFEALGKAIGDLFGGRR